MPGDHAPDRCRDVRGLGCSASRSRADARAARLLVRLLRDADSPVRRRDEALVAGDVVVCEPVRTVPPAGARVEFDVPSRDTRPEIDRPASRPRPDCVGTRPPVGRTGSAIVARAGVPYRLISTRSTHALIDAKTNAARIAEDAQ